MIHNGVSPRELPGYCERKKGRTGCGLIYDGKLSAAAMIQIEERAVFVLQAAIHSNGSAATADSADAGDAGEEPEPRERTRWERHDVEHVLLPIGDHGTKTGHA